MSRIPPNSVRLTSGKLNSSVVGTSSYYYSSQLKENIMVEKAMLKVGKTLNYLINEVRRGEVCVLEAGVLPIWTQLRGKRMLDIVLMESKSRFMSRRINGGGLFRSCEGIKGIELLNNRVEEVDSSERRSLEVTFMLVCISKIIVKKKDKKSGELVGLSQNKKELGVVLKERLCLDKVECENSELLGDVYFLKDVEKRRNVELDHYCHYPCKKLVDELDDKLPLGVGVDDEIEWSRGVRLDNITHNVKRNVIPKMLIYRDSGVCLNVGVNVLSFVEGSFGWNKKRSGGFVRKNGLSLMFEKHKVGVSRVKSGAIFELLLDKGSVEESGRLRPTISIRL